MSLVHSIHESHMARLRRIEAAAWKSPATPAPVITRPPSPKSPVEQLLDRLANSPKWMGKGYPKLATVQRIVAAYYNESIFDILSNRRAARVTHVRQIAMYLCAKFTPYSYAEIGRKFGRDHSTIIYGVHRIEALLESDPALFIEIEELKQLLGQMRRG
jgi:chromosomal replication initiator protein